MYANMSSLHNFKTFDDGLHTVRMYEDQMQ